MSQALYTKYRSRNLDEVLGQDHVIEILKKALKKGKIAHAYLLTGPRGTGKTSVARILAHEINQLKYDSTVNYLDIIEIDAASNNGVDHIRDLREKARISPVSAKYKVYIIDEVHMLSKPAFNALLKTLEEPPAHVIFILATTDADKLPSTILSRVQQYYFRPINDSVISNHLMNIAKKEKFLIDKDAADLIAEYAKGGFRDSISLLDQLSSLADSKNSLTRDQVANTLGLNDDSLINKLLEDYDKGSINNIGKTLETLESQGADSLIITKQLLTLSRSKIVKEPQYISLMTKLIEVTKHPHPDLKLLTILMANDSPRNISNHNSSAKSSKKSQVQHDDTITANSLNSFVEKSLTETYKKKPTVKKESVINGKIVLSGIKKFDWSALLNESKAKSIGLFGLLSQCDHQYENGVLTIYAGTAFTQKKLNDAKNRPLIGEIIQISQGGDLEITIISQKKPLSDKKLSSVAAAMGGGEEVNLEDIS